MKVSSVSEMRELDRAAVERFGIVEELLMENAGHGAYFVLMEQVGVKGKTFALFCGLGNNGGDGFVIARKIHSNGGLAKVFILGDPDRYKGAARTNLEILRNMPVQVERIDSMESAKESVRDCDVIVDAVFGTGLTRDVEGRYREVIEGINAAGKTVMSVDIPSGVHGDTGEVMGAAVKADHTVTFGLPKIGNMLYPGYGLCGRLYVTHISFPPSLHDADSLKVEINQPPELPPRDPSGHKGTFGDVLFIAGASSYFGAPYFAALSFLKAGGGYSRLAAPESVTPFIAAHGSEIVFVPQKETASGSLARENEAVLLELSQNADMVVLGPGVSLKDETQQLVRRLAAAIQTPLVVDGDGITAVSRNLQVLKDRQAPTVLTPHPGEMSRITQKSVSEILKNPVAVVQETAKDLDAVVILKGAHSLVGCPDGRVFINTSGNSGMGTAGSGDVLAGAVAAMFGLGLSVEEAVRTGVFVHGLAGDLAAEDKGRDGITAQDIMEYLPAALKTYRERYQELVGECYAGVRVV